MAMPSEPISGPGVRRSPSSQLQLWLQPSWCSSTCASVSSLTNEGWEKERDWDKSTHGWLPKASVSPPANTYMLFFQDNLQLSTVSTSGLEWHCLFLVLSYHNTPLSTTNASWSLSEKCLISIQCFIKSEDPEQSWNKMVFWSFFPNLWLWKRRGRWGDFHLKEMHLSKISKQVTREC